VRRASSSSATRANRGTRSAWTSSSLCSAPRRLRLHRHRQSFLTRLVLAGLIRHNKASVLVLDMHNEYGSTASIRIPANRFRTEEQVRRERPRGGTGARRNRARPSPTSTWRSRSDISTADIELLTRELNLKETTPTTLDALWDSFRDNWFGQFKAMTQDVVTTDDGKKVPASDSVALGLAHGVNVMAAEGLHSKLRRLFSKPYIVSRPAADA